MRTATLFLAALLLLSACGSRGALTLPPPKTSLADHSSRVAEESR